MRNNLIDMRIN